MKTIKLRNIIVSVILALVMVFPFAACTGDETEPTVDSIDIAATLAINVGEEKTIQVTIEPFGAEVPVTWKSSDAAVATVSDGGVVKGIAQGSAKIRATAGGKSADCTVTVTDPALATVNVTKVEFENQVVSLDVGGTKTLNVTVSPANATDKSLTWKSSKTSVATVNKNGEVNAVGSGNATITATAHNKVKATCIVKVAGGEETAALHVAKVNSLENRTDFIMGMDASAVPSIELAHGDTNHNHTYKNFNGEYEDVYKILKDNGITDIRIRIWNDPYKAGGDKTADDYILNYSYGGGNCDIENAVAISQRCHAVGLGVILNFHYSDFWADPGKQYVPKAWQGYTTTTQIKDAIYDYTKDSLQKVQATGVKITMVQIGNETTKAICGAMYDNNPNPVDYCNYINAGAKAVRDVTGTVANGGAKVAIHLTNPNTRDYVGYANTFIKYNVDYDVFGTSYYPYWHGTLQNLSNKLKDVHDVSGKDVMVLETSYAFSNEDFDGCGNTRLDTIVQPMTVQGQSNTILSVIKTIADLGDYGLGVCYWEGTWIAASTSSDRATNTALCSQYGCGWASINAAATSKGGDGYQSGDVDAAGGCVIDNQAFFTSEGNVLESLKVFKLAKTGQNADPAADYLYDEEVYYTVEEGEISLPDRVKIVLNDGSVMTATALWDADISEVKEYIHEVGDYVINGTTPYGGEVKCTVYVQNKNLLKDGGFEEAKAYPPTDNKMEETDYWKFERLSTKKKTQLYVSNKADDAEMGKNSFHFWDIPDIEFRLYQEVDLAKARTEYGNGKYGFSIDFAGGDFDKNTVDADGNPVINQAIYAYALITYNDGSEDVIIKGNYIEANGWRQWSRTSIGEIEITDNVASVKVGIYVKGQSEAGPWGNIDNAQFFFKSAS